MSMFDPVWFRVFFSQRLQRYRCGCSRSRSIGFTVDTSPLIQSAHIRLGSGSNPTIAQAGNLSSYHITGMKDLHSDASETTFAKGLI